MNQIKMLEDSHEYSAFAFLGLAHRQAVTLTGFIHFKGAPWQTLDSLA
jgi:hypothetical protein